MDKHLYACVEISSAIKTPFVRRNSKPFSCGRTVDAGMSDESVNVGGGVGSSLRGMRDGCAEVHLGYVCVCEKCRWSTFST